MGKDTWVDNTVVAVDENGNPNDCLRLYEYKERLQDVEESGDVIVKIEVNFPTVDTTQTQQKIATYL